MHNISGMALSIGIKAILSNNEVSAMHNNSEIVLLKALETTLSWAKVSANHNNIGIVLLVAINLNWTGGGILILPHSSHFSQYV